MSVGFKDLVASLQGDFEALVNFMDSPETFVANYELSDDEREALLSRDAEKLAELAGSEQLALGVLSGAHTPTCGARELLW
ncbi:MAG: hypothetical protein IJK17_02695 [Lachnospiraceae bacterium]|nr:hypothetical protein [Lachnospiraceae bacterium]